VIPALFDRREVRAYLARPDGTYEFVGPPLALPNSVLHLEPGPDPGALVALTDDGISLLRSDIRRGGAVLRFEPVIEDEPVISGSGNFQASLELIHDLDGDGTLDLLLPSKQGLSVYLGNDSGLSSTPVERIEIPGTREQDERASTLWYPLPEVRRVNGDELPDLVFTGWSRPMADGVQVYVGIGGGRFRPLRDQARDCHDSLADLRMAGVPEGMRPWPDNLPAFRDLDGDGRAESIRIIERSRGDGFRKEMKDAKKPQQQVYLHRLNEQLFVEPTPYAEVAIVGHTVDVDPREADGLLPAGLEQFVDLDGDGREDLVTITLEFSIFQVLKVLATKKIGIGVNFHVYAQREDGSFKEVPGLDLHEKLKFDLNKLGLGRFAQFAGDFDGDGRQDFVHLGRGKTITVHRGQPGCRYPKKPDLAIELEEEPATLELIRIEDLDGDGRSDLRVTRPMPQDDPDVTAPVRVDLYLTKGAT